MRGTFPFLAAALLFGPGCGLETSGLEAGASGLEHDGGPGPTTSTPGPDAAVPPVDSGGGADSTSVGADATTSPEAGGPPDATLIPDGDAESTNANDAADDMTTAQDTGPQGDACTETSDASATATIAAWPKSQGGPPKIDGDLSDWPCEGYVHFSNANCAYSIDTSYPLEVDIQVRWDAENLYVAAQVSDPNVGDAPSYDGTNPYNNDSVEMYVSGDATLDGSYDANTHQYITDYQGLSVDYGPLHAGDNPVTPPPNFSAAAVVVTGGWNYEASVSYKALGLTPMGGPSMKPGFAPGTNIALGFEVSDGTGVNQAAAIVLVMAPVQPSACKCTTSACCCNQTPDVPSCDSTRIERVTLE
jgi:hypothetical protein